MQRKDINTIADPPTITVQAKNAKNSKTETAPLSPKLAREIAYYFNSKPAMSNTKVFSGIWQIGGSAMLREDLKLAGIEYETYEGFADFHSLRHTLWYMAGKSRGKTSVRSKADAS